MTSMRVGGLAAAERPVVRLRSPTEICEAVPYLVGFEPSRSLVVVSLRGPRQRTGLTMRVDLPEDADNQAVAAVVVGHLARDRAGGALLVAYANAADPSPDSAIQAVLDACRDRGIRVAEALRVADGRWTSYTCQQACCPPTGTPLTDRLAEPGPLAAAMTIEGRQVLASREALEQSLAPVVGVQATAMRARLEQELDDFLALVGTSRTSAYGDATVELAHASAELASGTTLTVDATARLIVGMLDRQVRDRCLAASLSGMSARWRRDGDVPFEPEAALDLWRELVRRAVLPGLVAPVATLLAACAYLERGSGALANIALDRALDDEPTYTMALYLRSMLDGGISPDTVRKWFAESDAPRVRKRRAPHRRK